MGIFSRRPTVPRIEPTPTHLDIEWFRDYVDDVFDRSGVDPNDRENTVGLLGRITSMLGLTARSPMLQNDAAWAWEQTQAYIGSDEGMPWNVASLVAGWDVRSVPVMEQELDKFRVMVIDAGRRFGEFRDE
ncbi:hypothetical protein [Pseudonocardia xishanensis]|uniref:Uncharacterized protein n=1 Tax=Pseudonocardia xishanensis TaxID=630995 RepID=A0ABP8RC61_9PSEU